MGGKGQAMAWLWALALVGSAALVAAGRRWPAPLPPQAATVWLLLLLPPLATLLWLVTQWSLGPDGQEGQSEASKREQR
jgi:hypothetical protein